MGIDVCLPDFRRLKNERSTEDLAVPTSGFTTVRSTVCSIVYTRDGIRVILWNPYIVSCITLNRVDLSWGAVTLSVAAITHVSNNATAR